MYKLTELSHSQSLQLCSILQQRRHCQSGWISMHQMAFSN